MYNDIIRETQRVDKLIQLAIQTAWAKDKDAITEFGFFSCDPHDIRKQRLAQKMLRIHTIQLKNRYAVVADVMIMNEWVNQQKITPPAIHSHMLTYKCGYDDKLIFNQDAPKVK